MSSARLSDEFIVREHFAEDHPRVVLVVDRRPSMSLFPAELPWLNKPAAVAVSGRMIVESALAAQGFPGYLDLAEAHAPRWIAPNRRENAGLIRDDELARSGYTAPKTTSSPHFTTSSARAPTFRAGSFVFVLSDFLVPPPQRAWRVAGSLGWDLVPVLLQDADLGAVVSRRGRVHAAAPEPVRLSRRDVTERRAANEQRLAELLETFAELEVDPVLLSSAEPLDVLDAFMRWHERRRRRLSLR